ncbi:hypothetical protein [Edwardsiella tarda]
MTSKKKPLPISGDLLPKGGQLPSTLNSPMPTSGISVFQQINPLEHISNSIKTICYYKEQCKLIDLEIERIEKNAEMTIRKIDKLFLIEMEKLKLKKEDSKKKLGMAADELRTHALTRKDLMLLISGMIDKICSPDITVEDKKILAKLIQDFRKTLESTNNTSYSILELLMNSVSNDIDNAELLGGGDNV